MENRSALLISSNEYQDVMLSRLASPQNDVVSLSKVLRDPTIGDFGEVKVLINKPSYVVREEIANFFIDKKRDDLILLYFSGHGVLDINGKLYLAAPDTKCNLLRASAISANYLSEVIDDSRSRRIVLILDCCHSGAFSRGGKGSAVGTRVRAGLAFEGMGYGRVVLTASDATQYAWEGKQVEGSPVMSIFTKFFIEGLCTGAADLRRTGKITVDDLYDYIYDQIMQLDSEKRQTPGKWSFKQEGDIVIGKNSNPSIVNSIYLPKEIQELLNHPVPTARLAAVHEIEKLITGHSYAKYTQSSKLALEKLKNDDSRAVSEAASKTFDRFFSSKKGSGGGETKRSLLNTVIRFDIKNILIYLFVFIVLTVVVSYLYFKKTESVNKIVIQEIKEERGEVFNDLRQQIDETGKIIIKDQQPALLKIKGEEERGTRWNDLRQ